VHSSRSRATSDPVAFHNKTRDQADFLSFSVKRPFQNEISLTPPGQDLRGLSAAYAGPSFAPPWIVGISGGHQTTAVELVKGLARVLCTWRYRSRRGPVALDTRSRHQRSLARE
jgi:hypothetical protein